MAGLQESGALVVLVAAVMRAASCSNSPEPDSVNPDRLCEIIAGAAGTQRNALIPRPLEEIVEEGKLRWEEGAKVAPREIRSEAEEAAEIWNDLYNQVKAADFDETRGRATVELLIVAIEDLERWGADNCGQ